MGIDAIFLTDRVILWHLAEHNAQVQTDIDLEYYLDFILHHSPFFLYIIWNLNNVAI